MEFGRATMSPDRIPQPETSFVDVTMLDPFFNSETEPKPDEGETNEER